MNYFIADIHAGHVNVLTFDNRPFVDIKVHDDTIAKNWNNTVTDEDDVWVLGDISWYNATKTIEFYEKLKGRKHLIIGNHDLKMIKKNAKLRSLFVEICDYKELKIDGEDVVLSHYPIPCFNKHYYGAYHFYGHVHNSFESNMMEHIRRQMEELYTIPCNMLNVGVMMLYMNFTPRSFKYLKEIIKNTCVLKKEA